MEDRDYKFIHQHSYDESGNSRKKYHHIIVAVLSVCLIIELLSIVALLHFSTQIKESAKKLADGETEDITEEYTIEGRYVDSFMKQAAKNGVSNMDEYKKVYNHLKEIVQEAEKYVVTVCTYEDDQSLLDGRNMVTSGIVVAKSPEIVIITDLASTVTSGIVYVTFFDGKSYKGKIMDTDETLGIVAIKVAHDDMPKIVYDNIQTAEFADKEEGHSGESVIVMGNPYGKDSYAAYGNITSVSNNINIIDGSCHLLTTDINKSKNMNGFVINLDGEVMGMVNNTLKQKSMDGIVSALVIWDAEGSIENMVKGIKKAYLGIEGEDITEEIIQIADEDMPFGIYVKGLVEDSPAYNAGILCGDIIVKINESDVRTMYDMMNALAKCKRGQEIAIDVMRKGRDEYKSIEYDIILASGLY